MMPECIHRPKTIKLPFMLINVSLYFSVKKFHLKLAEKNKRDIILQTSMYTDVIVQLSIFSFL